MYSRVLGQLGQLQQVLRDDLWTLWPLRVRSVPQIDDVIVKATVRVDPGLVQGSHCTGGRWGIRSETFLKVVVVVNDEKPLYVWKWSGGPIMMDISGSWVSRVRDSRPST